jgi:hypothetical protein
VFNTLWWTTLQQQIPPQSISRVISYDYAGSFALGPVGLALAGPLAAAIGVTAAVLACSGGALIAVASTLFVRDVRELESNQPPVEPATGIVTP